MQHLRRESETALDRILSSFTQIYSFQLKVMNLILERRHSIWTMFETTEIKVSIILCVIKRNLIFGQHLKVEC